MKSEGSFKKLCASLDLEEDSLDVLLLYLDQLLAINVNLNDEQLQQAIEGHIGHLETACRSLMGYAGWLVENGQCFDSQTHATRCFTKALIETWEPIADWERYSERAVQARYISPYERVLRLGHQINQNAGEQVCHLATFEPLTDKELEEMIPVLEKQLEI
jgi:hypothetical protein